MKGAAPRLVVLCSLIGLLAGCTATPRPDAAAPTATPSGALPAGWLRASGGQILDIHGRPVRLTGLNVGQLESSNRQGSDVPDACGRYWRGISGAEAGQIAGWGFNSVRLQLAWANLEPRAPTRDPEGGLVHHWNLAYLREVDREIHDMTAQGLDVILDMHQWKWSPAFTTANLAYPQPGVCEGMGMPAWLFPEASDETLQEAKCNFLAGFTEPGVPETAWQGLSAAWSLLANRYRNNPRVVGADILNEPFCGSISLDPFYETIGPAIHRANPHLLLVFEGSAPQQMLRGTTEFTSRPDIPNAVYSFHLYSPNWAAGRPAMNAYLSLADRWNVPVYVGEFNAFGEGSVQPEGTYAIDPNWRADTEALLSYALQHDVSWAYSIYKPNKPIPPEIVHVLQGGL